MSGGSGFLLCIRSSGKAAKNDDAEVPEETWNASWKRAFGTLYRLEHGGHIWLYYGGFDLGS
jgi:hypothetical protein